MWILLSWLIVAVPIALIHHDDAVEDGRPSPWLSLGIGAAWFVFALGLLAVLFVEAYDALVGIARRMGD